MVDSNPDLRKNRKEIEWMARIMVLHGGKIDGLKTRRQIGQVKSSSENKWKEREIEKKKKRMS